VKSVNEWRRLAVKKQTILSGNEAVGQCIYIWWSQQQCIYARWALVLTGNLRKVRRSVGPTSFCGSNACSRLFRAVACTMDMHRLLSDLTLESAKNAFEKN